MENISESYAADVRRVISVSDFTRHASSFLGDLSGTRTPLILTVNGKAAAVVQDADTYQEMVDLIKLFAQAQRVGAIDRDVKPAFAEKLDQFLEDAENRSLVIHPK